MREINLVVYLSVLEEVHSQDTQWRSQTGDSCDVGGLKYRHILKHSACMKDFIILSTVLIHFICMYFSVFITFELIHLVANLFENNFISGDSFAMRISNFSCFLTFLLSLSVCQIMYIHAVVLPSKKNFILLLFYFICSLFNITVSNFTLEWLDSKQLIGRDMIEVEWLKWRY